MSVSKHSMDGNSLIADIIYLHLEKKASKLYHWVWSRFSALSWNRVIPFNLPQEFQVKSSSVMPIAVTNDVSSQTFMMTYHAQPPKCTKEWSNFQILTSSFKILLSNRRTDILKINFAKWGVLSESLLTRSMVLKLLWSYKLAREEITLPHKSDLYY